MRVVCLLAFVLTAWLPVGMVPVAAQEKTPAAILKRGSSARPDGQEYLAIKYTNVREKPDSTSKVVDRISKGTRIVASEETESWLKVTTEKGKKGFANISVFLPLIDGSLKQDLSGSVELSGKGKCEIKIIFDTKTVVEEEMFEISDYEVLYDCNFGADELAFTAYMFITEAPYKLNQTPHYQISVDLREVGGEQDQAFSAVFIYKRDKAELVFDGLTMKGYASKSPEKSRKVAAVPPALMAAAEMAAKAWGGKVWEELQAPPAR